VAQIREPGIRARGRGITAGTMNGAVSGRAAPRYLHRP
jgi:hypothetical protein